MRNLNLEVERGQVYGFLGPNGAGKTTTIRMLMDLVRPSAGRAEIHGRNVREAGALARVGGLVEGPAFYGYLSGRNNLEVLARTANDYRPERIRALLEQVGLAARAAQPVGAYSMGMKQRLGVAAALLGDPDLVVLDEPTNGLDPAGIQEMRGFIRGLAKEQGKTVFISSHLLNEVEQTCDRVAIIHKGEMIREGPVAGLLAESISNLRIQAAPLEQAEQALRERWEVARESVPGDAIPWLVVKAPPPDSPRVVELLVGKGVRVHQVVIRRQTLESYFLAATSDLHAGGPEAAHD
ncbi:MAG: ABC transporter ATP-binding protein [Anaerolineales bacterium]|nr:ABC transporter ATP-binding protein [Anaerolineales bacterium]